MSSAYGQIQKPESSEEIPSLNFTLKDGMNVVVQKYTQHTDKVTRELRQMLNDEIKAGCTYPQEQVLSGDEFCQYFLSSDAFIVTPAVDSPQVDVILGTFYIKPNFPGRCSHVCNGGFVTHVSHRNKGVGRVMGEAFKKLAPMLGYKASMFNLVFVNNEASVRLWRSLGFEEIGRIKHAGRLANSAELVDAIMFFMSFIEEA